MDTDLSPSHLEHITYADKGKSKSSKALGKETCILLISLQDHSPPHVYLQRLQNDGYGIDDLVMLG